MILIPLPRGASLTLCGPACLNATPLPASIGRPEVVDRVAVCVTCYACGLTTPASTCICNGRGISCAARSWELTGEAHDCLSAIYEDNGPTDLTDHDWDTLTSLAERFRHGAAVAAVWAMRRDTDPAT